MTARDHAGLKWVCFTRDGKRVVLRDGEGLSVLEVPSGEERVLPGDGAGGGFADLVDFVGFVDEVWVAAGRPPRLHRFSIDGAAIGEPLALPAGASSGRLLAAQAGEPAALWIAGAACEVGREEGALRTRAIDAPGDFLLPLSPGRRLELRHGVVHRVEADGAHPLEAAGNLEGARLIEGCALFDERAAALVIDRGGVHSLLVIALEGGLVQHRLVLEAVGRVRMAPARGHAVVLGEAGRMQVFDLRFGRSLKQWSESGEVVDFAVDPAGQALVVVRRAEDGTMETLVGSYREVVGGGRRATVRAGERAGAASQASSEAGDEPIAAPGREGDEAASDEDAGEAGQAGAAPDGSGGDRPAKAPAAAGPAGGVIASARSGVVQRGVAGLRRPRPPVVPAAAGSSLSGAGVDGDGPASTPPRVRMAPTSLASSPASVPRGIRPRAVLPREAERPALPPPSFEARLADLGATLRELGLPDDSAGAIARRITAPPALLRRLAVDVAAAGETHDLEAAFAAAHRRLREVRLRPGRTIVDPSSRQGAVFDALTEDGMAEVRARAVARGAAGGVVAVLAGAAGSGRRLAAEILAGQLSLDLHRVAAAELGAAADEATLALGRLLEETEAGGLLLHVTAADRLLAGPPPPALLERLAGFTGLVLFSLVRVATLDPALRPLVSAAVPFAPPDVVARQAIWRLYLPPPSPGDEPIDLAALAQYPLVGGEIHAAVARAALLAAAEGARLGSAHYQRAARLALAVAER